SGRATYSYSSFSASGHTVTASYTPDSSFNSSTSATLTQTVNQANSSIALVSSNNPSVFGQSAIFAATVSAVSPGAGTPTGTVTFSVDGTPLETNTLAAGVVRYTNTTFSVGSHLITAAYNGDGSFNTSTSSTLTQTVAKASTTNTVTSSLNPSVVNNSVTFTATVSAVAPGNGTPT